LPGAGMMSFPTLSSTTLEVPPSRRQLKRRAIVLASASPSTKEDPRSALSRGLMAAAPTQPSLSATATSTWPSFSFTTATLVPSIDPASTLSATENGLVVGLDGSGASGSGATNDNCEVDDFCEMDRRGDGHGDRRGDGGECRREFKRARRSEDLPSPATIGRQDDHVSPVSELKESVATATMPATAATQAGAGLAVFESSATTGVISRARPCVRNKRSDHSHNTRAAARKKMLATSAAAGETCN
jgi:hypothetical protein